MDKLKRVLMRATMQDGGGQGSGKYSIRTG